MSCVSARDFERRPVSCGPQNLYQMRRRQRDAALRRPVVGAGDMKKDRASATLRHRVVIVTELDNYVVDRIFAPHPLARRGVRKTHKAIVIIVPGRVAPAVVRGDRADRERRLGPLDPVGSIVDAAHRPNTDRRGSVALSLVGRGCDPALSKGTPDVLFSQTKQTLRIAKKVSAHVKLPKTLPDAITSCAQRRVWNTYIAPE